MAVDAVLADLDRRGATPAAVEAGGDFAVGGLPPGRASWPIRIELPSGALDLELPRGAAATSGISRRTWRVDGELRHHLIDPRTGRPAVTDLLSVTVAAASCREAEVVAKCALILGRADGAALLRRLGLTGLLVTEDGVPHPVGWTLDDGVAA